MRDMKDSEAKWVGKKPTNWELGKIKYYARIKTGSTPSTDIPEWFDGDINWFTPGDFSDAFILKKSSRTLSSKAVSDNIVFPFPKGIVMIVGIGATAGKVGFTIEEGYCNQQITALIPYKINPKFLMYWLVSNTDILCGTALYTTLPIINNQMLGNHICLCPIDICLQKRIADFLDKKCSKIDALTADIKKQIETLKEYKRAVITEAVTKGLNPDVEMKDSGVEWIGLIPKDWVFARIGSLYGLRVEKVSDRNYQPLSVTKLGILPQLETVAKTDAHDDRKLVKKGDFAINSRSDRRGSCGISEYDGSVSLINTVLYPITEMSPQYYNWLFHTTEFADEFYRWGHGIVDDLWTTGWQEMKNIVIVQPPLPEQCRIAAYLDRKCSEIDSVIKEKQQQLETLAEYKKSLIYEYVTGKKEVI